MRKLALTFICLALCLGSASALQVPGKISLGEALEISCAPGAAVEVSGLGNTASLKADSQGKAFFIPQQAGTYQVNCAGEAAQVTVEKTQGAISAEVSEEKGGANLVTNSLGTVWAFVIQGPYGQLGAILLAGCIILFGFVFSLSKDKPGQAEHDIELLSSIGDEPHFSHLPRRKRE